MNKKLFFPFLLAGPLAFLLVSCGPKDISTEIEERSERTSVSTAEQMRFPHFGSDANQRMLFNVNRMDSMTARQRSIGAQIRASNMSPEREEYRRTPKQQSPFRQ